MKKITRKGEAKVILQHCLQIYQNDGLEALLKEVHQKLLMQKVKFPLLEYCASILFAQIPKEQHLSFCNRIAQLQTIGGNVLLGIFLQLRLPEHLEESFQKAAAYIAQGEKWYVSDIIGERVYGAALLQQFSQAFPLVNKLTKHQSPWVLRALGAGSHYAVKKGLEAPEVERLFKLLLRMNNTRDIEVKRGVGWAAKTTARFHPSIIKKHWALIQDLDKTPQWFRSKIKHWSGQTSVCHGK